MQALNGTIAATERDLMVTAFGLMLIVVIPVILLTFFFAWRYRASATKSEYQPDWDSSPLLESVLWGVPAILIAVLGTMVWASTHRLDPYRPIASENPATRVQAVAQDWKWLFIYPDLGIATVNELAFPQDRPLALQITSDVAMNSFMIPDLGGQIYAMAGMETQLHLSATQTGSFEGRNMQFSGDGFSNQTFVARALSTDDYEKWLAQVRATSDTLTEATYKELKKPSVSDPVTYYSAIIPDMFQKIVAGYAHGAGHGQVKN